MAKPQPERREPPVAWLCLRYSKMGPARFTSARDIGRLMERALKRAQVPVAYSSGFNPHQRVSYAFPAPTGAASQAEYALVALAAAGQVFLASSTVMIERRAKSGVSRQDVRGAVVSLAVAPPGQAPDGRLSLVMTLRQGDPLIRPGDVLAGLAVSGARPLLTRQAQGSLRPDGEVENLL